MKIAESWLREWVDPELGSEALAQQLTMLGHEADELVQVGTGLDGVVIGEVVEVGRHPDADRLSLCKVSNGNGELLDIVCGAPNVRQGMKTPLATPGVVLPNGLKLRKSKIRGVVSHGMLCSATELHLGEDSDGILSLPDDAPVGEPLADYLGMPDTAIDLDLTPNRGDCFSVLGIARDVSAVTGAALKEAIVPAITPGIDDTHSVIVDVPEGCPNFAGRVIRNIDPNATSPLWMVERLRRSGLRAIHPVVDITNYVMLELGQPLHAYDLAKVTGPIRVRMATPGEKVTLLDDAEIEADDETMVIADDSGALGLAGIKGGLSTAVSDSTVDVFFEGAFWSQSFMAGRARRYGLHTDASLRFERGADPTGQARAVERATELLLEIAGGEAGPLTLETTEEFLPKRTAIRLRRQRIEILLGARIDDDRIVEILTRLGMNVEARDDGWDVLPPSYRFDMNIEVDLIEEIARIYGYDQIPEVTATAETPLEPISETQADSERVAEVLLARDYQEAVTYSFVDPEMNTLFSGEVSELLLSNPISTEMAVMRTSLWPSLVAATAANAARQQDRVRLFEIAGSFHGALNDHHEVLRIAGSSFGRLMPEQWASQSQSVDFFDIKSDVEALLALAGEAATFDFVASEHPALQPGQVADIHRNGEKVGVLGKLHPKIAKRFDLKRDVFLFELDAAKALASAIPSATAISKFPAIRRDIAVVVEEKVSSKQLLDTVAAAVPDFLESVRVFDIFRGRGIEAGRKSVAIGLILQETSRTLTDDDADAARAAAVQRLQDEFNAELRD